ncbi:uncharacterized protein LOC132260067 [Phlebotomus argentipes]|uniref:uncharacterized protein LOC132260067 n=1 Tax=Phlebotomus argentipes TaxID=94469 RepID=UPI0028929F40|nr:uncharacterized protein LOC132260067 [Phlebotomus argentipes]
MEHHARRSLTADKLKAQVRESFDHLRKALAIREKLLLRQVEVLQNQTQQKLSIDEVKFIPENDSTVINSIREFGKFNLENYNFANDLLANEDYICPAIDHETLHKCVSVEKSTPDIDFSNNRTIITENANYLNDSIINIILSESKELIEGKSGRGEGAKATQSMGSKHEETPSKSIKCCVSNMTINRCSGTLNLKNISHLTINTTCKATPAASSSLEDTANPHTCSLETSIDAQHEHPGQIQQWLKQIISETETEPIPSDDILEHSRIDTQ